MEVLAELKLTLNRREQFALEKVLVDELLGLGPLEELLADPDVSDIMVNGPEQTYIEKKGKLQIAPIKFRDEEHLFQIARSEEHTSELQSLMSISYAVFCLKNKKPKIHYQVNNQINKMNQRKKLCTPTIPNQLYKNHHLINKTHP